MARGTTIAMKGSSRGARHPLQTCTGEEGAEPNQPLECEPERLATGIYHSTISGPAPEKSFCRAAQRRA